MNMWWEFRFFVRLPSAEETEGLIDVAKQAVLTAVADGCGASSSGLQFGSKPEVRTDVYYALDDARGLKVRCKGKRASSGEPYDESFELKVLDLGNIDSLMRCNVAASQIHGSSDDRKQDAREVELTTAVQPAPADF